MTEEREYLHIPDHVPVKRAAEILGISEDRVLQHIKAERLQAKKVEGRYMILKDSVEHFQHNPPGRIRTKPAEWRIYNTRSKLLALDIQVQVRPGQQERLQQKLKTIHDEQRHTFPGTMARYILKDDPGCTYVRIWLIWKDIEMPDEAQKERNLAALKEELDDVLDWDTACIGTKEGLIYT